MDTVGGGRACIALANTSKHTKFVRTLVRMMVNWIVPLLCSERTKCNAQGGGAHPSLLPARLIRATPPGRITLFFNASNGNSAGRTSGSFMSTNSNSCLALFFNLFFFSFGKSPGHLKDRSTSGLLPPEVVVLITKKGIHNPYMQYYTSFVSQS